MICDSRKTIIQFKVDKNPCLFKDGPNPNMYGGELSKNAVDVESMLRGIGSTNLEGDSFSVVPKFKPLKETSYFDKLPMIIPPSYETRPERPNYLG